MRAQVLAGKDGRLTANEAARDPFVADAYARAGKQKPVIGAVASAARQAMLSAASTASNGDGRVSKADAKTMPAIFAQGFQALRGAGAPIAPQELAAKFGKLTEGLLFMSESDDPYTPFVVSLKKEAAIDGETLKQALDWSPEEADFPHDEGFQISVHKDPTFWEPSEDATPQEIAQYKAIDKAMKGALGEIYTATVREEDSSRAPYYIFGRLESGELVGLKTWRTWT